MSRRWNMKIWMAAALAAWVAMPIARAESVRLDVHFKLTDPDYRPLPDRPVRLAFGSDPDWAAPDVGQRARTDANGEAHFTATVEFGTAEINRDTTWLSVLSSKEAARSLGVFVGLEYLGAEWLYGLQLFRFDDGDVMREGFDVYLPDEGGRYTRKFGEDRGTHTIALPDGLVLSGSGNEPWENLLEPADDGDPQHWILKLSFKREPDPVRR